MKLASPNPEQEPYLVVAGVMVNADKKWKALEKHLSNLADEFIPDRAHSSVSNDKGEFRCDGFVLNELKVAHSLCGIFDVGNRASAA